MERQRCERAIAEAAGARQPGEQLVGGRAAAAALRGEQLEHERTLDSGRPARRLGGGGPGLSVGAGAGDRQAEAEADAEAENEQSAHGVDTSGRCRGYCMTTCAVRVSWYTNPSSCFSPVTLLTTRAARAP